MIYNTISIKSLLSKIYRDLKPNNSNWESEAIEWAGEALSFIGTNQGFVTKKKTLKVKDYRTLLPYDFYTLQAVYYGDNQLPYGGNPQNNSYIDEAIYIAAKDQVLESNNFQMTRYGSKLYTSTNSGEDYYIIVPNYIQTSFETGDIEILYNAWPLDADGLPEIPDTPYYTTALQWYVLRQMILGGYEHPNKEFTFSFVDTQWKHYCLAAQNDAVFPSEDKVRRFNEMWVSLVPSDSYNFNLDPK